jgi:hypothetical protein
MKSRIQRPDDLSNGTGHIPNVSGPEAPEMSHNLRPADDDFVLDIPIQDVFSSVPQSGLSACSLYPRSEEAVMSFEDVYPGCHNSLQRLDLPGFSSGGYDPPPLYDSSISWLQEEVENAPQVFGQMAYGEPITTLQTLTDLEYPDSLAPSTSASVHNASGDLPKNLRPKDLSSLAADAPQMTGANNNICTHPISTSTVPSRSSKQLYTPASSGKPKSSKHLASARQQMGTEIIRQLELDESKENLCLVKSAIARGYNIKDVIISGIQALGPASSALPSPQKNTITLVQTSTLEAFLSVAEVLGYSIMELHNKNMISPFYRGSTGKVNPAQLTSFPSRLSPHLRPTPAQILYPHHPWMDLLPFPALRDRIIILSSMQPVAIDLADLENDIFMKNGLFHWRPPGRAAPGQPWDMRSWEAERWFLKKWRILLGGQESEIWSQTNWWRETRGEGKVE